MIVYSLLFLLFFVNFANATPLMCTMCTAGIASGLGIAKLLGVPETVIGLWCGALLLAIGQWSVYLISKKKQLNLFYKICVILSSFVLIIPLYLGESPTIAFNENKICCIDAFLFSNIAGVIVALASALLYQYMKKKNGGHPHFPYERVVLPLCVLIIMSFVFYFNN